MKVDETCLSALEVVNGMVAVSNSERVSSKASFPDPLTAGIKHRSTEHNSSLMVSESEFDSDQDTIFSRENPRSLMNGSTKNGVSFSYSSRAGK